VALVAALHVYFLILEMFLWTKPLGLKTFRQSLEKATDSAVLAANQGLYNGFLAAGPGLGAGPGRSRLRIPDQDVLSDLRHHCRYLRSRDRQPQDPVRAGFHLSGPPHLALRNAFLHYRASDGILRVRNMNFGVKTTGSIPHP
jgi:hypothetical protein